MQTRSSNIVRAIAAALMVVPVVASAQSPAPLRSYAVSGTETSRSYDPSRGWTQSIQPFTGTFDLVSTTEARLTKVYADGSSVVRDLILHWTVDLNAPTQGGTAAEVPDPTDPVIKRTTYSLGLQFDGLRYTMSGNFMTRAWMSVIPGVYDWFNVAYGDFSGCVVSPVGSYDISGSEKAGKTTATYTGTFTLVSPTAGQLTRTYADGTTATVNLALQTPVDVTAPNQTVVADQVENPPGQAASYTLDLQLNDTRYAVSSAYATVKLKGKTARIVATGAFTGTQP